MSDKIELPLDADATRQQAVDEVIAKVTAARGTPDRTIPVLPSPNMKAAYNPTTGEIETSYSSPADEALAHVRAALPQSDDILDGIDLEASQRQLEGRLAAAQARLDSHKFRPDGTKQYEVTGLDRENLERVVADLTGAVADQRERYDRALAARAAKAENAARTSDAQRLGDAWVNGDPAKRAALDKALREREAAHIADAMIRTSLGQLD